MQTPLISAEILQKTDKILFITHLALGDFTYLRFFFDVFNKTYPNIKIHIWVDETRRTRLFWRWNYLKKYALYDWLEQCPFIEKFYRKTYTPYLFNRSCKEALTEKYSLVVSLATLRPHRYARLARKLSPRGFIVGAYNRYKWWQCIQRFSYKKLNARFEMIKYTDHPKHISTTFSLWFEKIFGLKTKIEENTHHLDIPKRWILCSKLQFLKWKIDKRSKPFSKVFFINPFAKTKKRCWPLERVVELISTLKKQDTWNDVSFVVNIASEDIKHTKRFFKKHALTNTFFFSAEHNFFQLPAIMAQCELIISVETAIMHIACALKIPTIVMMRQKNPEWAPLDKENSIIIITKKRSDWINTISIDPVLEAIEESIQKKLITPTMKF